MSEKFSKEDVVSAIRDYFNGEQWRKSYDMIKDPAIDHIHIYIDSCLNPYTIDEVAVQYLERDGYKFSNRPYHGAIQDHKLSSNIEADDLPPFEFYSYWNPDLIMAPQAGREEPEVWTGAEVDEFIAQFDFAEPTESELAEVRNYFRSSPHWTESMRMVTEPDMEHLHINIESKLHPDVLRDCMAQSFAEAGWDLNKISHMIFSPSRLPKDQKKFYGKLMVMLRQPPVTRFDVAWVFNKDVTIRPSTEFISDLAGVPEYDVGGTRQMVERYVGLHPFITLTPEEVSAILR